ncbi:MAG: protein kinase [Acidaminococcaceae bacterium]|nr:protein kinase [Acidaminococcaceae bacterium]
MQEAIRFIQDNFKPVAVLKDGDSGLTELVISPDKTVFIRKTIPYTGLPYRQMMQLSHPLLPKIYYAAEDASRTYVIEQYVEGENLQALLDAKGNFSEQQVRNIGLQLCDALEYLHQNRILHRDIKTSNIILKDDGAIRLLDFGAARIVKVKERHAGQSRSKDTVAEIADRTDDEPFVQEQDTRILGTPGYAPPEQYGFAATDFRSDYYALGMTLQTLLGNRYKGTLTNAIRRCVELDPERRIGSAQELRNLLQVHWYDALLREKQKYAVLLLVLCLLGAGLFLWQRQETKDENAQRAVTETATGVTAEKEKNAKEESVKVEMKSGGAKENSGENAEKTSGSKTEAKPSDSTAAKATSSSQLSEQKQTPPIVSPSVKAEVSKPSTVRAGQIQFSSKNWSDLQKTEQHLPPIVADADKVIYSPGQWPKVTVANNSDAVLQNPQIEMYFNDFGVLGSDLTVTDWNDSKVSSHFSEKTANGLAHRVILRFEGVVQPHDSYQFNLFGGVSGLFKTGANPSVRIVFSADNADAQEKSYTIGIK